ncbi:MAG: hypothetical protein E7193_05745 [Erysipelotrichaceae bacterium]|nr:hypothetical protein [Erysipelotrichaceae bacterium]
MQDLVKWTLIIFVITIALEIAFYFLKRYYINKLANALVNGNSEEFERLIHNRFVRYIVPPFNREYMELNNYIATGNDKKTREMFETFRTRTLNNAQKKAVDLQGFNFYLTSKDASNTRYYLDELGKLDIDEKNMTTMKRLYSIIIENDRKMLDRIVEETERMTGDEKLDNQLLLAQVYANLDDKENAEKYLLLVKEGAEKK